MDVERETLIGVLLFAVTVLSGFILTVDCRANDRIDVQISEDDIQKIADSTLTLLAFTVLPDITTSSLSISNDASDDLSINQWTLGGGFTISDDFPLYLEGTIGYSRYDHSLGPPQDTDYLEFKFQK